MVNRLFDDFDFFIDIKKRKKYLQNALQIQYIVERIGEDGENGSTWVQAINTFATHTKEKQSGDPVHFKREYFDLLKIATIKQWILALTWEECIKELPSESASLLGGYILYYEKILDIVMESGKVEILEKWLEIELVLGGKHVEKHNSQGRKVDWNGGLEGIRDVVDFWNLGQLYKLKDPRGMSKRDKKKVFLEVKNWLKDQWKEIKGKDMEDFSGELSLF
jgi:hypothetical protein